MLSVPCETHATYLHYRACTLLDTIPKEIHNAFQGSEGVPVAEPLVEGLRPDVVAFHFTKIFASSVIIPQVKERHSEHTNTRNRRQSASSAW